MCEIIFLNEYRTKKKVEEPIEDSRPADFLNTYAETLQKMAKSYEFSIKSEESQLKYI